YQGEGLSVMEMSHRSKTFDGIIKDAEQLMKEVMNIPDGYKVVFMQGGATMQFAAIPLNLLGANDFADYVNTGSWSKKAIAEARKLGKEVNVIASSEDDNFSYIPKQFQATPGAAYLHITSNNTIAGTQYHRFPDTADIPLICDMSSDINCRPVDVSKFGLIYAGAQKNMGPSGVTIVIIREELLEKSPDNIPTMTSYKIIGGKDSLYNTPPTFGIYMMKLVLEWMKETGGLEAIGKINEQKAALLYDAIDKTDFYRGTTAKEDRSIMNVTFRLPDEELEKKFVAEALEAGMIGLKGHRSVGGCRASIYNAVPMEAIEALVSFMAKFEKNNA
ncbi:MAG TPA: 3-phosphoserine/phosphohydroxythreonine transaminase, partial [Calditrichaeota bacterium]|nr:3-phosphoserine/phosphohydroxythreonine transaminase [Calditrichota bacterium]